MSSRDRDGIANYYCIIHLVISAAWLIKQLDSEPASANQVTTQETVSAIPAEIVALVPVATSKQSQQKRGHRMLRPHTRNDCAMCRHEGVDPDNDDEVIAEVERIRRVIPADVSDPCWPADQRLCPTPRSHDREDVSGRL